MRKENYRIFRAIWCDISNRCNIRPFHMVKKICEDGRKTSQKKKKKNWDWNEVKNSKRLLTATDVCGIDWIAQQRNSIFIYYFHSNTVKRDGRRSWCKTKQNKTDEPMKVMKPWTMDMNHIHGHIGQWTLNIGTTARISIEKDPFGNGWKTNELNEFNDSKSEK